PLIEVMQQFADVHLKATDYDLVTAVPLHKKKLLRRGFNQAEILARNVAKKLELPYEHQIIRKIKDTTSQSYLDKEERFKNVAGIFSCESKKSLKEKSVLLIDDIFTTGATTNACSLTLKKSGVAKVTVFTLAQ
ncbi:MAG: ComF family protein, partial [Melioribacteraceae bacterium]|nr:ComF family protein [Melioribacteraceae bacterium]